MSCLTVSGTVDDLKKLLIGIVDDDAADDWHVAE